LTKEALAASGKVIREFESREKFSRFINKQIEAVRVVRLKHFGQSVYDTSIIPTSLVEKLATNSMLLLQKELLKTTYYLKRGVF
jgi:hypothetical protein